MTWFWARTSQLLLHNGRWFLMEGGNCYCTYTFDGHLWTYITEREYLTLHL